MPLAGTLIAKIHAVPWSDWNMGAKSSDWLVGNFEKNCTNNIQLLHTLSLNSVLRPSGIFTLRVVTNTLFIEKKCAIVVLLYSIGQNCRNQRL